MATYRVKFHDGSAELIEAASFVQDGSGIRLYDSEGGMVAVFRDGEATRCSLASNTTEPAAPEEPEV